MTNQPKCHICGEPMPEGETMFKFHGYSGPCPKPPLNKVELDPAGVPKSELTILEDAAIKVLNKIKAYHDGEIIKLPEDVWLDVETLLLMATVRRKGVQ
jgi:hypothetical protein